MPRSRCLMKRENPAQTFPVLPHGGWGEWLGKKDPDGVHPAMDDRSGETGRHSEIRFVNIDIYTHCRTQLC